MAIFYQKSAQLTCSKLTYPTEQQFVLCISEKNMNQTVNIFPAKNIQDNSVVKP